MIPNKMIFAYNEKYECFEETSDSCCVGEIVNLEIHLGKEINAEDLQHFEFRIISLDNELCAVFPLIDSEGNKESDWVLEENNVLKAELNLNTTTLINMFEGFGANHGRMCFYANLDYLEENDLTSVFSEQINLKHWQRITKPVGAISIEEYRTFQNLLNDLGKISHEIKEDVRKEMLDNFDNVYKKSDVDKIVNNTKTELTSSINEVNEKINSLGSVLRYKGNVSTKSKLPTNAIIGDVYNVEDTGMNYAWSGTEWDELSPLIDLSGYVTKKDLNNHTNNYNNPHRVTPERIGALPTVDGVAENLKKKTITDKKTTDFYWGSGSYGTIKAVFNEYGLYEGYVDISGNWVREPQENLSMYSYGSVPGLREDLSWYNVSCNGVYPDENASDENYDNCVYNFYLGYDESSGYFLEVAFEMYEYNEEIGDYEYRYIVEPCSSSLWEAITTDSPVLSEYELLDEYGIIKSEKMPYIDESDPKFDSWKRSSSISAGQSSQAYSYSVAYGPGAKATGMSSTAIGRGADTNNIEEAIAIGHGAKVTNTYGVQIGKGTNNGGGFQFGSTVICREGAIPAASLDIRRHCYVDVNSDAYYAGPENIVLQTRPFKDRSGNEYPSSLDSSLNQGAIIIGNGAKLVNQTLTPRPSYFGAIVIGSMTGVGMYSTPEQVAAIQPPQTKYGITIGSNSISDEGVSIGHRINSVASRHDIIIGSDSISTRDPNKSVMLYSSSGAVVIGKSASGDGTSVTIGQGAKSNSTNCVVIGRSVNSNDAQQSIAIGAGAKIALSSDTSDGVFIENAVQLGAGTNSKSNSLQFLDTTLFENGKLNLDTIVLNDSVANADGTVNEYKLKVTNGVLGVELITEEVTA